MHSSALELDHQLMHSVGRQRSDHQNHSIGPVPTENFHCAIICAEIQMFQLIGAGVRGIANDAIDPESRLRVIVNHADQLACFGVCSEHSYRARQLPVGPMSRKPGTETAAHHEQGNERQATAEDEESDPRVEVKDAKFDDQQHGEHCRCLEQTNDLKRSHGGNP